MPGVTVRGALVQIGTHKINRDNWDWAQVDQNPFFCPDAAMVPVFEEYLDGIRKAGSSIGAVYDDSDGDYARFFAEADALKRELAAPLAGEGEHLLLNLLRKGFHLNSILL